MQKDDEQQRRDEDGMKQRQAEATSSEGVTDLSRAEKSSGAKRVDEDQPSPDGQFDEREDVDRAGPA